jgi:hypothetical protein
MKIDFEFETKYGKFVDALHFEDSAVPDDATIEAMKQERVDNWVYHIENPPVAPPSKYKRDQAGQLILDVNGDPIPNGV